MAIAYLQSCTSLVRLDPLVSTSLPSPCVIRRPTRASRHIPRCSQQGNGPRVADISVESQTRRAALSAFAATGGRSPRPPAPLTHSHTHTHTRTLTHPHPCRAREESCQPTCGDVLHSSVRDRHRQFTLQSTCSDVHVRPRHDHLSRSERSHYLVY